VGALTASRRLRRVIPALLAAACAASACSPAPDEDADRRAILSLYEAQRAAHFQRDAEAFLAAVEGGYWAIGNGTVRFRRKAEALPQVRTYLESTRFEEVRDVAPPRVTLSPDGRSAWLIGQVEVRGARRDSTGAERPMAFRAAWMDVYRKDDGRWRLVARANTEGRLP